MLLEFRHLAGHARRDDDDEDREATGRARPPQQRIGRRGGHACHPPTRLCGRLVDAGHACVPPRRLPLGHTHACLRVCMRRPKLFILQDRAACIRTPYGTASALDSAQDCHGTRVERPGREHRGFKNVDLIDRSAPPSHPARLHPVARNAEKSVRVQRKYFSTSPPKLLKTKSLHPT